jgi:hypothetical protein
MQDIKTAVGKNYGFAVLTRFRGDCGDFISALKLASHSFWGNMIAR